MRADRTAASSSIFNPSCLLFCRLGYVAPFTLHDIEYCMFDVVFVSVKTFEVHLFVAYLRDFILRAKERMTVDMF